VILYLLLAIVSFSCIGEEALNAEADILSCALPGVAMTTSPIINNNSITIFVGPGTDISELTPEFTLTPGATINPLSGTERNFNTPQEYTVTAADGVWKKTYIISVIDTELATNYNFEDTLGGTETLPDGFIAANTLAGTNNMQIFVCGNEDQILLMSRFDNLGKGASGAAIQNMNIMLGINEATGLE
jgi:hypothetical protein